MATAYVSTERVSYDEQLSQIRMKIQTYFQLLVDSLKERERQLLTELEKIVSSHKREKDQHKQSLSEIEFMLKQTQENIHSNVLKETQVGIVKMLEQQQREIESNLNYKPISFDFDNTVLDKIKCIGKITVDISNLSSLPLVEYKDKVRPVVSVGGEGKAEGQFNSPWGVAVDYTTDNIYVVDQRNNRVQVLDRDGNYLFKFGDAAGAGKMICPFSIAISEGKLFVSQNETECLFVYNLNGTFLNQLGSKGFVGGQFQNPFGIAIDEVNGDIYVCDLVENRVQIFSKHYSFISQFGRSILKSPRDIKLTRNNIFVLCEHNPFLFTFDYCLTQVNNIIPKSISEFFNRPFCMVIDGAGRLIISDNSSHSVYIFNPKGLLLHRLTCDIRAPSGVALDSQGRVIVVGFNNRLLIF